jgi:hypothetical protein
MSQQPKAKWALQQVWMAEIKKDAPSAFDAFVETWGVNTIIGSNASSRIATPCSGSTTFQQSTESICAQRMSSKAHSQRSAIATCAPRGCVLNNTALARDLQTCRGRREKLAAPRRSQSAAESYPWSEVRG